MLQYTCSTYLGLLRQILKEVKTSTQSFDQRLSELEQKITDLCEEDTGLTIKKKKVSPSPEVRVSGVSDAAATFATTLTHNKGFEMKCMVVATCIFNFTHLYM